MNKNLMLVSFSALLLVMTGCKKPPQEADVASVESPAADAAAAPPQPDYTSSLDLEEPMPSTAEESPPPAPTAEGENYGKIQDNPIIATAQEPTSTFSIDVDTGGYSNVRRFLNAGNLPPKDAVRVEEMINYFKYVSDVSPKGDEPNPPFSVRTERMVTPWNAKTQLLRIGIQGWQPTVLPPMNLVFLLDVSGSMDEPNKLPLLKTGLKMLTKAMRPNDTVSIVVYAGAAGVVLPPTSGTQKDKIIAALNQLSAGGSTNGGEGIALAYRLAHQVQKAEPNSVTRVLLATDGDFNVGNANFEDLIQMVSNERKSGIGLSTLGFGDGNYNENLMEQLADTGNGNYAYIDSAKEAHRVLVEQRQSTLYTIAKDVKIQVEFNPAIVSEYRLIGYENRALKNEDFNNDKIDAGEIGAGHHVTALYEIALKGSGGERLTARRYGAQPKAMQESDGTHSSELGMVRLRYKHPKNSSSQLIEQPVYARSESNVVSSDLQWAAAVAAFGQKLRGNAALEDYSWTQIERLAEGVRGNDLDGSRSEFKQLIDIAASLSGNNTTQNSSEE